MSAAYTLASLYMFGNLASLRFTLRKHFRCSLKTKQCSFCYSHLMVRLAILPRCVDLGLEKVFRFSCLHRKEVIQPHLPIRLPCYDFTPIIGPTFDGWLLKGYLTGFGCCRLSWCDGRCVQGPGTYSPQHADLRLLAIPTSRRRVSASDPN